MNDGIGDEKKAVKHEAPEAGRKIKAHPQRKRNRGKGNTMNFSFDVRKTLERNIESYLTAVRESNPQEYRITMFMLFTRLNCSRTAAFILKQRELGQRELTSPDSGIPVAVFNKTIGDMKRVGIIGTCKGGEEVFLSNAAWELHVKEEAWRAPSEESTTPASTDSTEVRK